MQVMTKFSLELMNWDIISHLKEEDLSEIIQATKGKVLHSLVKANEVFAVMDKGDHQCFAPLTWEDDCFTFGALQEEQPSASALKLPFNEFVNQTAPVYAVVCKGSHQLVARTTCVNGGFCLDSLREMSIPAYSCKIPLLDTLIKAGLVYAVDEDDPRGGVAQLSKLEDPSDTRLALHVLKAEPLPQNIFKMPYSYLRSLVGDSSVSVFLDLEWGDVTQGQVHIRLDATSGRGQQFLELCTGERGPSYIDTKFLSVGNRGNPGEFIIGGDYEHNDGTGGAAVLSGLDHSEGIPRNIVVGLVSGHNHGNKSSQFLIYTKDLPGSSDCMSFGKVKVGMDVLLAVVGLSNPQDVKVKDCGVFVSL
ncbi:uncharacterized protein LOC121859394 [Homarus americanus]|uniref:uncharacterized protein LOC121859394 n=1 Tax=Homarus americanus TaxID=6706 RepID=UPI001C43D3ED|nr:uncharacterized protein LOC121859394 [Homarus americanus]